jgi:hypothetical protein
MKLVKILIALVILVILIIGIGIGALFMYIDSLARHGIERGATYALDVPTTLNSADVGVLGGTFEMSGLNVANPQGFSSPHFLDLGSGKVGVTLASLREDVVELPELTLSDIDVHLERSEGKANYNVILESLKRFESGTPKEPNPDKEPGKEFVIRTVTINNINAHVQLLPIGGEATKVEVNVPEIILTDVGQGGVPMSQLVNVLTQAILESIVKMGGGVIPADLLNDLQGQLGSLAGLGDVGVQIHNNSGEVVGRFGDLGKNLTGAAEDTIKKGEEALDEAKKDAEDALKGVKNLLGGDKDEK